ncbi:MATE family efflux transporter [Actinomycetospora sp. C-140]
MSAESGTASRRRPVLGVTDQLLSSGTNFLTAFVASWALAPTEFATFVVSYAVVTVVLALGRAVIGEVLLAYLPTVADGDRVGVVRSAAGAALLLGALGSVVCVGGGLVGHDTLAGLLWLAPWVPVALLQDASRFAFLSQGRPGRALASDGVWAGAQVLALVLFATTTGFTVAGIATAWGIGALAGLVVAAALGGASLRPCCPRAWARRTRSLSGWFVLTSVLGQCEIYAVLVLAGTLLAPGDAAGLRAVQLMVFQPAATVAAALLVLATPLVAGAVARRDVEAARHARRFAMLAAGALAALVLAVIPLRDTLLALLFPQYTSFSALVVPIALQSAFYVLGVPFHAQLRGFHRARTLFGLQVLASTVLVGAASAGMGFGGVVVLAWGLAGAALLVDVLLVIATPCWRRAGDGHRGTAPPAVPTVPAAPAVPVTRPELVEVVR